MSTVESTTLLGDVRRGKLAGSVAAFGRTLRRAGVPVDAARIALAQQALLLVGVGSKVDVGAALEAVLVGREQDRAVFRELFDAFFRDPEIANKLLAQIGFRPVHVVMSVADGYEAGIPIPLVRIKAGGGFGKCSVPISFQHGPGRLH